MSDRADVQRPSQARFARSRMPVGIDSQADLAAIAASALIGTTDRSCVICRLNWVALPCGLRIPVARNTSTRSCIDG